MIKLPCNLGKQIYIASYQNILIGLISLPSVLQCQATFLFRVSSICIFKNSFKDSVAQSPTLLSSHHLNYIFQATWQLQILKMTHQNTASHKRLESIQSFMMQQDKLVSSTSATNFTYQGNSMIWFQSNSSVICLAKSTLLPLYSSLWQYVILQTWDSIPCKCASGHFVWHALTPLIYLVISYCSFRKVINNFLLHKDFSICLLRSVFC